MLGPNDPATRRSPPLCIAFAGGSTNPFNVTVRLDTPWLAGPVVEEIFPATRFVSVEAGVHLFRSGSFLVGHARDLFVAAELADRTESLYRRVFAAIRGWHLVRIWNYLPQINSLSGPLENYRAFCKGRSFAFASNLGEGFKPHLPAASTVGSCGAHLDVIFAATEAVPQHFENPEQIPAYDYPAEHGPHSPSFARATIARDGSRTWTFVSGTSAIKGHRTVSAGSLAAQIDCTLDNLRLISRTLGLGDDLGANRTSRRHFKIYLRHATDLDATKVELDRRLLQPSDQVIYLNADICRAALNIEIEATLVEG